MPDLRIVQPDKNNRTINRRVVKFGRTVMADNQTIEDLQRHLEDFLEHMVKRGYYPIKELNIESNYYLMEKGIPVTCEDKSGNINIKIPEVDTHYFYGRFVYIKNLSKEIREVVINHYKERCNNVKRYNGNLG